MWLEQVSEGNSDEWGSVKREKCDKIKRKEKSDKRKVSASQMKLRCMGCSGKQWED